MGRTRMTPFSLATAVVLGIVAIGAAITALPTDLVGGGGPQAATAIANDGDAFAKLFREGVDFLKQGRTHEAIIVLEAANQLKPQVPEVPVNLGFAYLARGKHEIARRHFEKALEIKADQVNAYYGLGMALQQAGDVEAALGALRTFLHFEKEESPFWRKAAAAVWEMEDERRRKQTGASMELPPGSVALPERQRVRTYDEIRRNAPSTAEDSR